MLELAKTILLVAGLGYLGSSSAAAAQNMVEISKQNGYRIMRTNGIPDHPHDKAAIKEQQYAFYIRLDPKVNGHSTAAGSILFGVALNGVPFTPYMARYWNDDQVSGWRYYIREVDNSGAHLRSNGAYYYHSVPYVLVGQNNKNKHSAIVGYAADGFPIYAVYGFAEADNSTSAIKEMQPSFKLKAGSRSGGPEGDHDGTFVEDYEYIADSGDLDECNGRFGVTPEYSKGIYHYFLTNSFPHVPRCFMGTPNSSFNIKKQQHLPPSGGAPWPGNQK